MSGMCPTCGGRGYHFVGGVEQACGACAAGEAFAAGDAGKWFVGDGGAAGPEVCGLPLVDMPEGITPLAAVVVVKALDEDGEPAYYARATDGLLTVEAVGMLAYGDAMLRLEWAGNADD